MHVPATADVRSRQRTHVDHDDVLVLGRVRHYDVGDLGDIAAIIVVAVAERYDLGDHDERVRRRLDEVADQRIELLCGSSRVRLVRHIVRADVKQYDMGRLREGHVRWDLTRDAGDRDSVPAFVALRESLPRDAGRTTALRTDE